jgi:uncharacterized protein (TIGR02266 family)
MPVDSSGSFVVVAPTGPERYRLRRSARLPNGKVILGGGRVLMNERRRHPRLSVAVEIDFGSEHNFYAAHTRDISVGGVFIDTDIALPLGTRLRADLKLLEKRIQAEGEVTWVLVDEDEKPVGVGVRFLDLPGPAKKSIEAFMGLRAPMTFSIPDSD